jgi:alkylhydroperoxidase family enzyme
VINICSFPLHIQIYKKRITDDGILDATLVVAYFNFVNRIVLALGLEVNEAEMKGYKY